ncbi:undecaprenyldiphospho-muramoylpentapeptide beta-N-acetylglucosaminyltransferase [Pseudoalteromonas fenneropenaei]|uniref:UDP-N-acetylglucosamine--N-acetylmuramyl-(pentapeptide) pyrophosphoryl-undecaprenol N-acetylglucosamine transferase n=1 Tax=Pseudoalteromonas fenneropenaei TaxID=1737459 RepID=A0ABV7CK91_9GAMM
MSKRLLVVAGGTGGHIFPGIAVAEELKARGWQVSWIGTADRMEAEVVPKHGIEIDFIQVKGVRGNGIKRLLGAPWMVIKAVRAAMAVIKQRRPDVILAMGGYVTGPVGVAAKLCGVPLVIHEQNAIAGMSNRYLAKLANRVLAAFPGAFSNAEVVGNPVRASVAAITAKAPAQPLHVLIVGGSLGAEVFNEVLPPVLAELNQEVAIAVRHQTGKGHCGKVQSAYQAVAMSNAQVDEFIHDMDAAYAWADLVICRAGALTVSEIAAAGKMALFVPYPHAVDDHQTANARFLVEGKAAHLLAQKDFNREQIMAILRPYISDPAQIGPLATAAKALATINASTRVADVCEELTV